MVTEGIQRVREGGEVLIAGNEPTAALDPTPPAVAGSGS